MWIPSVVKTRELKIHRQQGAIGIYAALVLMLALLFTVLAVDTGRLALEKRRLQRIADLSALHAVNIAACGGTATPDAATVTQIAQQIARANGYEGDLGSEAGAVTLGSTITTDGIRSFSTITGTDSPAVKIITTSDLPSSLILPGALLGNTRLQATAVATKQVRASFRVGSFLTRLNTGESILNPLLSGLLGTNVALDLVGYKGLAATQVTLLDLINATAGVGTVDELLKAELSVGDLLTVLVSALDSSSTASIALGKILSVDLSKLPTIKLGDILQINGTNPESALDAKVNVFDLVTASLQLANKNHLISVPNIGVNLGSLLNLGLSLYVIEAPKIGFGPPGKDSNGDWLTQTSTAQIRLQLNLASDLDLGIVRAATNLKLYLDAGRTDAYLKSVKCATTTDPIHHVVIGAQPGIASLGIGQYADIMSGGSAAKVPTVLVEALGLTVAEITASASSYVQNPTAQELTFDVANTPIPSPTPEAYTQTVGTSVGAALGNAIGTLANTLQLDLQILPELNNPLLLLVQSLVQGILNVIIDIVAPILQELLTLLGNTILDPLLSALGIRLGGADVTLLWLDVKPSLLAI